MCLFNVTFIFFCSRLIERSRGACAFCALIRLTMHGVAPLFRFSLRRIISAGAPEKAVSRMSRSYISCITHVRDARSTGRGRETGRAFPSVRRARGQCVLRVCRVCTKSLRRFHVEKGSKCLLAGVLPTRFFSHSSDSRT